MTISFLRTTAVSITALSLSACMSGQGSPWSPEFGQAQAPQYQQSTYGQSQYQYGQYPMPNAQANTQTDVANNFMATMGLSGSQHLSPLPNTYAPQPMTQTQPTQTPSWTGQHAYNSQYSPSTNTGYTPSTSGQTYQQQVMDYTKQTYESAPQKSYQAPYASNMTAPARSQMAPAPYMSQSRTYGQTKPATMAPRQTSYGQTMKAPMMSPQSPYSQSQASYAQPMKAPMTQPPSAYVQPMSAAMRPQQQTYNQPRTTAPIAQTSMMQPQMPQNTTIPWGQAMAWMYQGQVASAQQSPNAEIKLTLLDGRTVMTQSPRLDDVKRLINDCGVMCQNMQVTPK